MFGKLTLDSIPIQEPIIMVVGDHGEGLGQHAQPGHGRIWNEQVRVPMMLMAPGIKPGRHAETVGEGSGW